MKKTENHNIYRDVLPEPLKSRTDHIEGIDALTEAMIGVLKLFIEVECDNGEVPYHPKPENYEFREDQPYRGIIQGHVSLDRGFIKLVDAYWFFKVEAGEMRRELAVLYKEMKAHDKEHGVNYKNDFLKKIKAAREAGKQISEQDEFYERRMIKEGIEIDDSLPPYVPYTPSSDKYDIKQIILSDGYVNTLTQQHIIEIAKNYPSMWC